MKCNYNSKIKGNCYSPKWKAVRTYSKLVYPRRMPSSLKSVVNGLIFPKAITTFLSSLTLFLVSGPIQKHGKNLKKLEKREKTQVQSISFRICLEAIQGHKKNKVKDILCSLRASEVVQPHDNKSFQMDTKKETFNSNWKLLTKTFNSNQILESPNVHCRNSSK